MRPFATAALASAVFLLAVSLAPARADEIPPLPDRGHALEFGAQLNALTTFDGATISWRQQRGEHAAWRFGVTVNGSFANLHGSNHAGDTNLPFVSDTRRNRGEFSGSVTRLTFPAPRAAVRPYFGLGVDAGDMASLDEETQTTRQVNGDLGWRTYQGVRDWGPSFGVFALFGLEWPFAHRFSLHAEYGERAAYATLHRESVARQISPYGVDADSHVDESSRAWTFDARSVHTGLSVFW